MVRIRLPQDQDFVILNTEGVKNLCYGASTNSFLRCAGVTFGGKSNQNREGCDSLALQRCTSVECSVCYKSQK